MWEYRVFNYAIKLRNVLSLHSCTINFSTLSLTDNQWQPLLVCDVLIIHACLQNQWQPLLVCDVLVIHGLQLRKESVGRLSTTKVKPLGLKILCNACGVRFKSHPWNRFIKSSEWVLKIIDVDACVHYSLFSWFFWLS